MKKAFSLFALIVLITACAQPADEQAAPAATDSVDTAASDTMATPAVE